MIFMDLMEEWLEKLDQTNSVFRVSFVGREEFVFEIVNSVGESDEGREKSGRSNVHAGMNRRKC